VEKKIQKRDPKQGTENKADRPPKKLDFRDVPAEDIVNVSQSGAILVRNTIKEKQAEEAESKTNKRDAKLKKKKQKGRWPLGTKRTKHKS